MEFTYARAARPLTVVALTIALAGCQGASTTTLSSSLPSAVSPDALPTNITKYVTGLSNPVGLAFDKKGNLYVSQQTTTTLLKVSPTGVKTTFGSGLYQPEGLTIDGAGNLYVGNAGDKNIVKITPAGKSTVLATGFTAPWSLAVDKSGNVYVSDYPSSSYKKITPAGKVSTFINWQVPQGIAIGTLGALYVSGSFSNPGLISKVSPGGAMTPIKNTIPSPLYDAIDSKNNLYVSSYANVWKIAPNGTQTNLAKNLGGKNFLPAGFAIRNGALYVSDQNGSNVYKITQ